MRILQQRGVNKMEILRQCKYCHRIAMHMWVVLLKAEDSVRQIGLFSCSFSFWLKRLFAWVVSLVTQVTGGPGFWKKSHVLVCNLSAVFVTVWSVDLKTVLQCLSDKFQSFDLDKLLLQHGFLRSLQICLVSVVNFVERNCWCVLELRFCQTIVFINIMLVFPPSKHSYLS